MLYFQGNIEIWQDYSRMNPNRKQNFEIFFFMVLWHFIFIRYILIYSHFISFKINKTFTLEKYLLELAQKTDRSF